MKALITHIHGYSTFDGPGIRTTVFFKGCNLCCHWCHSPENQNPHIETGKSGKVYGQEITVAEVVKQCLANRIFFDQSGGGVTFSGGDPMYYPDFAYACCEKLHSEGIHIALDTYGYCSWDTMKLFLPVVDLWLYDVKLLNPERHKHLCGTDVSVSMGNLKLLALCGANVRMRMAVIPGINMHEAEQIADLLSSWGLFGIDLFPYHDYGKSKCEDLGRDYLMTCSPPTCDEMSRVVDIFKSRGFDVGL